MSLHYNVANRGYMRLHRIVLEQHVRISCAPPVGLALNLPYLGLSLEFPSLLTGSR